MNAKDLLEALNYRQRERQELLEACHNLLQNDQRIQAAWLFGSSSRKQSDALSDLDLWTVVQDSTIEALIKDRRRYVEQVGPCLFCLESPRNAPAGGAYLMAIYAGRYGPQQIDWYWQPASSSCLPNDALLLFERQPLERKAELSTLALVGNDQDAPNTVQQRATFFWAMSCICAKKIARHDQESAYQILTMLNLALHDCQTLLGEQADQRETTSIPAYDQQGQFAHLRALVDAMNGYNQQMFAVDDPITITLAGQIELFFDLCQACIDTPNCLASKHTA